MHLCWFAGGSKDQASKSGELEKVKGKENF